MDDVLASPDVSAFSPKELDYLHGERRLARIATVGRDGTPHVVPAGWTHNREIDTIDVRGRRLDLTKKFRAARNGRVAIVIDDLASVDPWHARAVEVRGRAETLTDPEALGVNQVRSDCLLCLGQRVDFLAEETRPHAEDEFPGRVKIANSARPIRLTVAAVLSTPLSNR